MNIAIATNEYFSRYAYVLLVSIFENNRDFEINIYLMHRNLEGKTIESFKDLGEKYGQNIIVMDIPEDLIPSTLPHSDKWTVETYFRLALPYILGDEVKRMLYLDVDTICCKPLKELYDTDFEGKSLCMCRDMSDGKLNDSQRILFEEMLKDEGFVYHNAGVVLMDMEKMRKNTKLTDYYDVINEKEEILTALDQDLLNYVFCRDIKTIDAEKYNLFARIYFNSGIGYKEVKNAEVYIVHFTGPKPWSAVNLRTNIERLWWEYAKLTPFYEEMLEELLFAEIDSCYTSTNEFKLKKYKIDELKEENNRLKEMNQKLTALLEENKLLLEKLFNQ